MTKKSTKSTTVGITDQTRNNQGYSPMYRTGEVNYCPGCHNNQWIVGRFSAQCNRCDTALPFKDGATVGNGFNRMIHMTNTVSPVFAF